MKLVVIKNNFQVLLVPNYRDLRYRFLIGNAFSTRVCPQDVVVLGD